MRSSKLVAAISFSLALSCAWASPNVLQAEYSGDAEAPQRAEPYADWLLGSYLAAPLLATGAAFGLAGLQQHSLSAGDALAGIAIGALLPAGMHLIHNEIGLGIRAYLLWPLVSVGSGVIGGLLGGAAYALFAKARRPDDDDDLAGLAYAAVGATVGLVIGAVFWPIFDVADAHRRDRHRHGPARLTFGVVPTAHGGALGVLNARF